MRKNMESKSGVRVARIAYNKVGIELTFLNQKNKIKCYELRIDMFKGPGKSNITIQEYKTKYNKNSLPNNGKAVNNQKRNQ